MGTQPLAERFGPWAMITGASSGIGREFAVALAEAGFSLLIVARRKTELELLARHLNSNFGVDVIAIEGDLGDPAEVRSVLRTSLSHDVGLFVASAGFGTSGHLHESDIETERSLLSVNCEAVLTMSHSFAKRFVDRGRGGIVLLGSIVGFQGTPNAANYAASKAYVQSLAEAMHVELKPYGVDVISSAPGPVRSGFAKRANMVMGTAIRPQTVAEQTLRALGKTGTVRPGWLSKLLGYSLRTAPRRWRVSIMGKIMSGMTKHRQTDPA